MSLERAIGDPVEQPGGDVSFRMHNGTDFVACRVTADALWQLSGGRYRTSLQAFEALRSHIELVASEKYDAGHLNEDGGVTIKATDLTADG